MISFPNTNTEETTSGEQNRIVEVRKNLIITSRGISLPLLWSLDASSTLESGLSRQAHTLSIYLCVYHWLFALIISIIATERWVQQCTRGKLQTLSITQFLLLDSSRLHLTLIKRWLNFLGWISSAYIQIAAAKISKSCCSDWGSCPGNENHVFALNYIFFPLHCKCDRSLGAASEFRNIKNDRTAVL